MQIAPPATRRFHGVVNENAFARPHFSDVEIAAFALEKEVLRDALIVDVVAFVLRSEFRVWGDGVRGCPALRRLVLNTGINNSDNFDPLLFQLVGEGFWTWVAVRIPGEQTVALHVVY